MTWTLAASWVLVFALMAWDQGSLHADKTGWLTGGVRPDVSNRFGQLTIAQFLHGEPERALLATFIHYSLLHLGMNLIGLIILGPLLEDWYGSGQLLGLYVVMGFVGNVLAVLGRLGLHALFWANQPLMDPACGGGSGVICGMVGLLAVVGWRLRSRFGSYMKRKMIEVLVLTAVLGIFLKRVDNFGHAGGTIAGAVIGLFHPWLVRNFERKRGRWIGWVAGLCLLVAVGNHIRATGVEARARNLQQELATQAVTYIRLSQLREQYHELARRGPSDHRSYDVVMGQPFGPSTPAVRRAMAVTIANLRLQPGDLNRGPTAQQFTTLMALASAATERAPFPGEIARFRDNLLPLEQRAQKELFATRAELEGTLVKRRR